MTLLEIFEYLQFSLILTNYSACQAEAGGGELEVAPGDLTAEERSAFERAVSAGALRSLVAPWQPWWLAAAAARLALRADGTVLVREVAGNPSARVRVMVYGVHQYRGAGPSCRTATNTGPGGALANECPDLQAEVRGRSTATHTMLRSCRATMRAQSSCISLPLCRAEVAPPVGTCARRCPEMTLLERPRPPRAEH